MTHDDGDDDEEGDEGTATKKGAGEKGISKQEAGGRYTTTDKDKGRGRQRTPNNTTWQSYRRKQGDTGRWIIGDR